MNVAVFIYGHRLVFADADNGLRLVLQVHPDASMFRFYINEHYMVLRKHWVRSAADVDLDPAVVKPGEDRKMFFVTCVDRIGDHLLHLLAAAYDRDLGVIELHYDIAAMAALVELCSHIFRF